MIITKYENSCKHLTKEELIEYKNNYRDIKSVALSIFIVTFTSVIVTLSILCSLNIAIIVSGSFIASGILSKKAIDLQNTIHICTNAGLVFKKEEDQLNRQLEKNVIPDCQMIPLEHGAETEIWRARLIQVAEHNIVISGNYCGGAAFIRLLDLIEKRMQEKPDLKVVIISSPRFLNKKDRNRLRQFEDNKNFSLIESPDIWHISSGLKKSTNHTKVMTIDYGRYFIQGGSGIKANFVEPGTDDLSRTQYRNIGQEEEEQEEEAGLLAKFLPGSFRDQDFLGQSPSGMNTIGTETYTQSLLLAHRWEQYNAQIKGEIGTPVEASELGLLTGIPTEIQKDDSLSLQLLRSPPPKNVEFATLQKFVEDERRAENVQLEILAQGAYSSESSYGKRLEEEIEKAEREIHINHMYFHPNTRIFNALVAAANRGVKITIISNGLSSSSPMSHQGFVPRNRYNYNLLVNTISIEHRASVQIYEYEQHKKGNHKKVFVIDDTVIAGSSNLGLKSTEWSCDDELNFVARSPKLVEETLTIFQEDITRSTKFTDFSRINFSTSAAFQRSIAFLID